MGHRVRAVDMGVGHIGAMQGGTWGGWQSAGDADGWTTGWVPDPPVFDGAERDEPSQTGQSSGYRIGEHDGAGRELGAIITYAVAEVRKEHMRANILGVRYIGAVQYRAECAGQPAALGDHGRASWEREPGLLCGA